jgi:hypothetical protein
LAVTCSSVPPGRGPVPGTAPVVTRRGHSRLGLNRVDHRLVVPERHLVADLQFVEPPDVRAGVNRLDQTRVVLERDQTVGRVDGLDDGRLRDGLCLRDGLRRLGKPRRGVTVTPGRRTAQAGVKDVTYLLHCFGFGEDPQELRLAFTRFFCRFSGSFSTRSSCSRAFPHEFLGAGVVCRGRGAVLIVVLVAVLMPP